MFFIAVGLVAGFAIAAGPLAFLQPAADQVTSALVANIAELTDAALSKLPWASQNPDLLAALAVVLGVCAPGFAVIAFAWASKGTQKIRRLVGAAAVLCGAGALFVLPAEDAFVLIVAGILVAALLSFATGALLTAPLVAIGTVLAVRTVIILWSGTSPDVAAGTTALVELSGFDEPELWRFALIIVGLSPVAAAAKILVRD